MTDRPFWSGLQVHKVRFVASTLLDAVRKAETAPASAARAHAYLCTYIVPPVPFSQALRRLLRASARIRWPFQSVPLIGLHADRACLRTQGTSCRFSQRSSGITCECLCVPASFSLGSIPDGALSLFDEHRLDDEPRDPSASGDGMPLMGN